MTETQTRSSASGLAGAMACLCAIIAYRQGMQWGGADGLGRSAITMAFIATCMAAAGAVAYARSRTADGARRTVGPAITYMTIMVPAGTVAMLMAGLG